VAATCSNDPAPGRCLVVARSSSVAPLLCLDDWQEDGQLQVWQGVHFTIFQLQIAGRYRDINDSVLHHALPALPWCRPLRYWNDPEVLKKLGSAMGGVFDFNAMLGEAAEEEEEEAAEEVEVEEEER